MEDYQQQKQANNSAVMEHNRTNDDSMTEGNGAENSGFDLRRSTKLSIGTCTPSTNERLTADQEIVSDAANSAELQAASTSLDASSIQRKTWSARLRDKLEKREKETAASAAAEKDEVPDKRSRVELPASTAPTPPKPATRRPSGGQKKNKNKSHQHHFGAASDGSGFGGVMLGGAGPRPNQGKSTAYHLTPSLLEDVLNEKKMSLMRSPEVTDHLQILQRNVSIDRLLGTAPPGVKTEDGAGSARVKVEESSSNDGKSGSTVATIGEVMMVSIKKEGDSHDNFVNNITQSGNAKLQGEARTETKCTVASDSMTHGAYVCEVSEPDTHSANDSHTSAPSSDSTMNNPLDLTAHKNNAS